MKLVIINSAGKSLGELKLSKELLRRSNMLSERLESLISESVTQDKIKQLPIERLVENKSAGLLQSLDDDGEILGVPLKLSETCKFDFDKHMESITGVDETTPKRLVEDISNAKKYDARYKERPGNRIRFK